jgi:type II secretory pathway pseudopilin PulG
MRTSRHNESGDTLVEILVAMVIISLVASALFATIVTTASSSKAHRDVAAVDTVLRDYAEATKQAVRDTCTGLNAGAVITPNYTPPTGIGVSAPSIELKCPPVTSFGTVDIKATVLNLNPQVLSIIVRTP